MVTPQQQRTARAASVTDAGPSASGGKAWWKGAVIYQIYPRSFSDSNGDGVGDLAGIVSRLEYVRDLGVEAIWISPFYTSPMKDFGYDVSDFRGVDPTFGDLDDFKDLLDRAKALGLKVIVDQILGHTSDEHPWFQQSRSDRNNPKADWYVWADPRPDGSPPNNWLSPFGGSAWTWDSRRSQYYFHNFLDCQPDLNFHNPEVRHAQLCNLRHWLRLGVDGVRLDAVNFYFHDRLLRDNPPVQERSAVRAGLGRDNPYGYQRHLHDNTQPENLNFLHELRAVLDEFPERTSIGEVFADDPIGVMAHYTAGNHRLHMVYTFELLGESCDSEFLRSVISNIEDRIGSGWPCWALSNHDVDRCASRWGKGLTSLDRLARVALAMLFSLRGTSMLYQGEELGLPEADVPYADLKDPYGLAFWPVYKGRDGCRTPMVWDETTRCGFGEAEPWLPIDERHRRRAVSRQETDAHSLLSWVRKFLRWRRHQPALLKGDLSLVHDTGDVLCWIRKCAEQTVLVALNLTEDQLSTPLRHQVLEVLNGHGFTGRVSDSELILDPFEALFLRVREPGPSGRPQSSYESRDFGTL